MNVRKLFKGGNYMRKWGMSYPKIIFVNEYVILSKNVPFYEGKLLKGIGFCMREFH